MYMKTDSAPIRYVLFRPLRLRRTVRGGAQLPFERLACVVEARLDRPSGNPEDRRDLLHAQVLDVEQVNSGAVDRRQSANGGRQVDLLLRCSTRYRSRRTQRGT